MSEEKLKELAKESAKVVDEQSEKGAQEQLMEITGEEIKYIMASSVRKKYEIRPCSLVEMPKLSTFLKRAKDIMEEQTKLGKSEYDILIEGDKNGVLETFAEIIKIGISKAHPDLTVADVMSQFSLKDFPKAYEVILSLNDFLVGMRGIQQMI